MAYTTADAVRGIGAADPSRARGTVASLPVEVIEQAITDAQTRIDSTLGYVYSTPFADPVPTQIQQIALALAVWYAELTRRQFENFTPVEENPIFLRYQMAMADLTALANGSAKLLGYPAPGDTSSEVPGEAGSIGDPVTRTHSLVGSGDLHFGSTHLTERYNGGWGQW